MEVSEALAMAVTRAAYVNVKREAFSISFNLLFTGLLATFDATGEWLRTQFERSKADLAGLLRRRGLDRDELDRLIKAGPVASAQS